MSADLDCVILGAGVIGLAIARTLSMTGREILVVDCAEGIGTATSSRNSEVIHAGLYYAPGSLKALSCVSGRDRLYAWCDERGIPYKKTGKLIVAATAGETANLDALYERARQNGVRDLQRLNGEQARHLEPNLTCHSALLSPSTGIVDSHALMLSLQGDAENHGAHFVFHTPFEHGKRRDDGNFELSFGGDTTTTLVARSVINATGLQAPFVARQIAGTPHDTVPEARYCKGSYFGLTGRSPFSRLIYPMPSDTGLGIHLTLDLAGQARFGPDTQWVDAIDYRVDTQRAKSFYNAIRRYWPELPDDALVPAYSGIRPKITAPGQPAADFMLHGPAQHGVPGLVHLFGMESPGLTACLALADMVRTSLNGSTSH